MPANPVKSGVGFEPTTLAYECETAITGNPLFSRQRHSEKEGSTFSVDASCFVVFGSESGLTGAKWEQPVRNAPGGPPKDVHAQD